MKRGRISEPSSWGGLAAMCAALITLVPEETSPFVVPCLIAAAVVFGALGIILRERP